MEIDEFKTVKKHLKKNKRSDDSVKKIVLRLFNQILITIVLFLGTLIYMKIDDNGKTIIYENVYNNNLEFAKANELYQKYLGNILPLGGLKQQEVSVFSEELNYEEVNLYQNGAVLKVSSNYMVPVIESGIVVFMGEKEEYGNTIIVQQVNGIDVWYGNVEGKNIKMYDYVEKGDLLGEAITEQLYLVFQKEGKYLDYKEYLS